jgi:hypothetical protein
MATTAAKSWTFNTLYSSCSKIDAESAPLEVIDAMGDDQMQAKIVVVCHHHSCSVTVRLIWLLDVGAGSSAIRAA